MRGTRSKVTATWRVSRGAALTAMLLLLATGSVAYAATSKPTAPLAVSAVVPASQQANVSFSSPASNGGAAITSYTATATDVTNPANGGQTATGAGSPIAFYGLTNGDSYTFTVQATNSVGTSSASLPSHAVTSTYPGPPPAPTAQVISAGQASVSFSPPAYTGGLPITGYTVTAYDVSPVSPNISAHLAVGGQTATGAGSPITISGLTLGETYDFRVTATNATGPGTLSLPSLPVTLSALSQLRVSTVSGRSVKGKCVAATKANKKKKSCVLPGKHNIGYVLNTNAAVTVTLKRKAGGRTTAVAGKLTLAGNAGANTAPFNDKIGNHKLTAGTYQMIATPFAGAATTTTFKIAK
jgi:Fibronectin type III domain